MAPTPIPAHEVLAVVLQVRDGGLTVLLWQRPSDPFAGRWALPGGKLRDDETLGESIARQLDQKAGIRPLDHLEQLETRSDLDRDPRGRLLSTAYLALVRAGRDFAAVGDTAWHPVDHLPPMGFDHGSIALSGVARLRVRLQDAGMGAALAPETFTTGELAAIYSAALSRTVDPTNLRRVLTRRGELVETGERTPAGGRGGRPAVLYRFAGQRLDTARG